MSGELTPDPRYDVRFQRGYEAGPPSAPMDREEAPPPAGLIEVPRFEGPQERPADAELPRPPEEEDDEPANPWLRALVIVSVVSLLVAVALLVHQTTLSYSTMNPGTWEMVVQQLVYALPAPFLVAGIVGLAVRIAYAAVRR